MKKESEFLNNILVNKQSLCDMQIVFVDIVKYSKRTTIRQVEIINKFTEIVENAILYTNKKYLAELSKMNFDLKKDSVLIPTGDGLAIGMPVDWVSELHLTLSLNLLKEVHKLNNKNKCDNFNTNSYCNCHNNFNIRIGISAGKVILYKDINGNYNIAGKPINLAARVMDFAGSNQINFNEDACKLYKELQHKNDSNFHPHLSVVMKHGYKENVFQYINKSLKYLNSGTEFAVTENIEKVKPENKEELKLDLIRIQKGKCKTKKGNGELNIEHDFSISKNLITQEQFELLMKNNPSFNKSPLNPVENVTFLNAVEFCNLLSIRNGFSKLYEWNTDGELFIYTKLKGYRLPFEKEWEYSLKSRDSLDAILDNLENFAWYINNSGGETKNVGTLKRNEFGICDLLGNVWEWCNDVFDDNMNLSDFKGTNSFGNDSSSRVLRGGAFGNFKSDFEKGFRKKEFSKTGTKFCGFRIVLQDKFT